MQNVDECVHALTHEFPLEDVWLLDTARAHECGLDERIQLIGFVREGNEAHLLEDKIGGFLRERFGNVNLHAFPAAAIYQIPRPLLVKMAFTSGRLIYSHRG